MAKLARKLAAQLARDLASLVDTKLEPLYALTNFSASSYYATGAGGGEAGDAAGFGYAILVRQTKQISSTYGIIANTYSSNSGHGTYIDVGSGVRFRAASAAGSFVYTPGYTFAPSDLGRLHLFFLRHNGTALQAFTHRSRQQGVDVPIVGYSPPTFPAATLLGALIAGSNGYVDGDIVAVAQFRGAPTQAQIDAYYDAARTLGDLPMTMQGATITHKWPDRALLKHLTAPASIPDVVTGAAVDAMARVGTPSVVEIDTSRDGRRTLGVMGWPSAGNTYLTATGGNTALLAGSADKGLHLSFRIRPDQLTGVARIVIDKRNSSAPNASGFHVGITSAHALSFSINTTAGDFSSAAYVLTSADLGQLPHFIANFDPVRGVIQLFRNGIQVGADVAVTGTWMAGTQSLRVGRRTADGVMANDISIFDLGGGDGLRSNQEAVEHAASVDRTGRMQKIEGRTTDLFDFTADIDAAGGVLPTIFANRVGAPSASLTRVATGLAVAQRTERVWSYETTPIMQGVRGGTADYYTTAGALVHGGTGGPSGALTVSGLIRIESQSVPSATRLFASTLKTPIDGGFYLQTLGTNSTLWFVPVSAVGSGSASPMFPITAAMVGKLLPFTGVFDAAGGRVRLYINRAEQSSGTSISTTGAGYVPSSGPLNILRDPRGTLGSEGITVVGLTWGGFVPTLAEVQAQHDAMMAAEDVVAIPGRSQSLISFKGGAHAVVEDTLGGDHMTRVGSPTLVPIYTRAWGF